MSVNSIASRRAAWRGHYHLRRAAIHGVSSGRAPGGGAAITVVLGWWPGSPSDRLALLALGLFGSKSGSYAHGVALIPKVNLDPKRTAVFAVIAAVIGLIVIPILTVPAMLILGITWKGGPNWARITFIGAALLILVFVVGAHHAPIHHH